MNRFRLAGTAVAIAAALTWSGCKSKPARRKAETTTKPTAAQPSTTTAFGELNVGKLRKSFQADLKELTKNSHRLAGDPNGSLAAGRYVEKRLKDIGIEEIYTQTFPVVQPMTTERVLVVDGKEVTGKELLGKDAPVIYPMRPNMLLACVTPPEGLSGQTVYARTGEAVHYGKTLPQEKIVVLDFDCGRNWLNAFAFGARAVIFIGQDDPAANCWHHINLPANLPRFYVPAEAAEKLQLKTRPRQVTIKAAVQWTQRHGRNVIAVIRGTDPKFEPKRPPQAVVLAAPLDSLSEVPELSPGARNAANCAALLQMAEYLTEYRPKRDVILCFFDGEAQNHLGARAFYGALGRHLGRRANATSLKNRIAMFQDERLFFRSAEKILAMKNVFEPDASGLRGEKAEAEKALAAQKELAKPIEEQIEPLLKQAKPIREQLAPLQAEVRPNQEMIQELEEGNEPLKDRVQRILAEITGQAEPPEAKLQRLREQIAPALAKIKPLAEQLKPLEAKLGPLGAELKSVEKRVKQLQEQIEDLAKLIEAVEKNSMDTRRILVQEAQFHASDILEQLRRLRIQKAELEQELKAAERNEQTQHATKLQKRVDELAVRIEPLEKLDDIWNQVQRDLNNKEIREQYREPFERLLEMTRALCRQRLEELDIAEREAQQAKTLNEKVGKNKNTIVMHISLNLGDARENWTFIHGDDSIYYANKAPEDASGNYTTILKALQSICTARRALAPTFEPRAIGLEYDIRLFAPGKFVDSGAVARLFAISNLSVMTAMDARARQGQPTDRVAALNQDAMLAQIRQVVPFLKETVDHPDISLHRSISPSVRYHDTQWSRNKSDGPLVNTAGAGSAMADRPVRDAVVALVHKGGNWKWSHVVEQAPPGFVYTIRMMTNRNGNFDVPPHSTTFYTDKEPMYLAMAFEKDRVDPNNPTGSLYRSRGVVRAVTTSEHLIAKTGKIASTIFRTKLKTVVGYGFNHAATTTMAMRARSTAPFQKQRHLLCEYRDVVTVFAPEDARGVKLFNKTNLALLDNKNTKDEYQGVGISLDDPFAHSVTVRMTAHDLRVLCEHRLDMLRGERIQQPSLEIGNSKAKDIEEDAAKAGPGAGMDRWAGMYSAAGASARGVYGPLVGVMKDLVTAVVLLLLLAMPFAYAMERLLIGTPHIYRQIGWFALFFLVTFAVLYFVNPAFRIAATPIIIFLAFSIILLSSLVIFIMVRKLQTEIKKMQGLAATVHSADVSRLSTMLAAVNMGISTMRRRPLRTLLTAVTVVLLTFTILTFASFGSQWGIRRTYEGPMTGTTPRILVRHQLWSPIHEGIYDRLRGYLADSAVVVPRRWVSPTAQEAANAVKTGESLEMILASDQVVQHSYRQVRGEDGTITEEVNHFPTIAAAIGLDVRDLHGSGARQELFGKLLVGDIELLRRDGIFLTDAQRKRLGLDSSDVGKKKVYLAGLELTYAGVVKDELASYTTLEGSSVIPVDYQASGGEQGETFQESQAELMTDVESARFVPFNVDKVVIIPPHVAQQLGGRVRSLCLYPSQSPEMIQKIADQTAHTCELPTYVGDRTGVHRLLFTSVARASGWSSLVIPVVLGGLIIFATMLGSVSDREREIYTFSSLGLAPPHIASLFFAEASMYAVVGGMGGYMLGQTVTRVLGFLSSLGYVSVPIMNYSSTNAIVTILIVMCTVLISTAYPALKASRSANPGVQRSWKIPKPQADTYDLMFPFTVSAYDIVGVVSFLKEHFDNYTDAALGVFACTESHIFRQKDNDMLGFQATVALAPFDLGVTQRFALLSQPSDIEGIDEVRVLIYRLSGAHSDWQRSNRLFINDLRRQLLIWRSLLAEVMDNYRQKTLQNWEQLPVDEVTVSTLQAAERPQTVGEQV